MFYVTEKDTKDIILVYSVQYKRGYPFFTSYKDNQWVTRSAKHYAPIINL